MSPASYAGSRRPRRLGTFPVAFDDDRVDANGIARLEVFDVRITFKGQEIATVHDQLRHRRLG